LKKRGSNPVIDRYESILNSRDKVLSNTYDLIVNSNFKLSRINNVLSKSSNKSKYEDFIKKLNSLKELYKNCDNKYSSYSHYSYVNKSSNTPIFNYDIDLLEK
jgi:hypothetical protein